MTRFYIFLIAAFVVTACNDSVPKNKGEKTRKQVQSRVDSFLTDYTAEYQKRYYRSAKAQWALNTRIVEGDTMRSHKAQEAGEALADFTGSKEVIKEAQKYLEKDSLLKPLQKKQLKKILYIAGSNPEVAGDIVKKKIKAETRQTEMLYGYDFKMADTSITTNELDAILENSTDLEERLQAWRTSKEVGKKLKGGLANLQKLRNQTVQALDYNDFFSFQVSDYGMSTDEMMKLNREMIDAIWPLYRELHTWVRHKLASRYGKEVPEYLPAHWLPNRWGQEWSAMLDVEGLNFDKALEEKGAKWIVKEGEDFYQSLGYDELPETFYSQSSLYPLPADANYKKNNHASAWHLDLEDDVRSLMSVEPNTRWWNTVLHELGHIYYYQAYTSDSVPVLLRDGANRAYHEAIGTLIGLASTQKPFLVEKGLIEKDQKMDEMRAMLKEALDYIVLLPWASGVMTEFEHDLYAENLPKDRYNDRWWELKKKYQGIVPPAPRDEQYCDAASKTHINNDPAQYYDYALANVLLFQFHMHIANNILNQDPHSSNYYGSEETGNFLLGLMAPGATQDWRKNLRENLGRDINASKMVEYFKPLKKWLEKQNEGREHSLPQEL